MSPDRAAVTLLAGLAADPPEIAAARHALTMAITLGQTEASVPLGVLDEVLGAVDYLRREVAGLREALAIAEEARMAGVTPGGGEDR